MPQRRKIVLAFSGGLDTTVIAHWLKKNYQAEVIGFYGDIGQEEDINTIKKRAEIAGLEDLYIEDLKEEFVEEYIFPFLYSGALYERFYLLGTSLARPLLAKKQVEIAKKVKATTLAHGATGKGNDQIRFEFTYRTLASDLEILAPWRVWDFQGREDLIQYAEKENLPIEVTKEKPYSIDQNLFHISCEGGILEDLTQSFPDKLWITPPEEVTKEPEEISISFEKGKPVAINGKKLDGIDIISTLNAIGKEQGIGRIDIVENRATGIKSRGIYETPGGTILFFAHEMLEQITIEKELKHLKDRLSSRYAELIYLGKWFTPEREALAVFFQETQKTVTGEIRLKIYKGNLTVLSRKSPYSLYTKEIASFEERLPNEYAEGFIAFLSLQNQKAYPIWKKCQ